MKTMHYVKTVLLTTSLMMASCAKIVEKDSETSLDIGVNTGFQIDPVTGNPIVPTPIPPVAGPMDCSGQVVSVNNTNYNSDFTIWMDFYGNNNNPFAAQVQDSLNVLTTTTGLYEFYTTPWGSGASEKNETFFATIKNSQNTNGYPETKNCENFFMVEDNDNTVIPPATQQTYIGTFLVVAGETNTLTINHYCQYFRDRFNEPGFTSSQCASFHYGFGTSGWPTHWTSGATSSGCMICDSNSVMINNPTGSNPNVPTGICVKAIPNQ